MALTKISTDGVKDDAITKAKIPADQIEASELANNAVDTNAIQDDAVTEDKLANSINSAIAANTAKDLTALSASNLTSGTVPDARFPATLPAVSGANLTNLPASGKATNAIINGDMKVSQRGTSETGIDGANEGYRVAPDRWKVEGATFGTHTVSQSTESPNGFGNSYKVDCTTANTSLSAGSFFDLIQKIEGQDLQNFAKGTSDAKQFALSFYVKTNKTGTYVVMLLDHDNDRLVSKTYTVSNTNWNRYTLIFPADTTGGFDNDNNASLSIKFILVAGTTFTSGSLQTTWGAASNGVSRVGQVNFADSTSNEWHLTGVQLEAGDSASDFAHESYADTLTRCQRYFHSVSQAVWNNVVYQNHYFPTTMRANPTITSTSTGPNATRKNNWYGKKSSGAINGGVSFDWTAEAEL